MAVGKSGRLVIEIDPLLKRRLHSVLAAESFTLKDWFIEMATEYIKERDQPRLPGVVKKNNPRGRA